MFRIKFSREVILKLLYQIDTLNLDEEPIENLLQNNINFFRNLNDAEKDFIIKIIKTIFNKKKSIDDTISKNLIGWKVKRLITIDRNLLRMGIAESHFNDQKAIIIDDIIRIAKKYSEKDSYKIINAILDKVIS